MDLTHWPALTLASARTQVAASTRNVRVYGAALVFALASIALYSIFSQCDCIDRQYDDAYITFRYAHNLATGKGLVFNPGDPTDSASSFLYTILLAVFELLGVRNLPRVATVIGIASAGAIAALVYLASLERTRRPVLSVCLAMLVALHGLLSGWAVSGMETLFYAALVIATLYRLFIWRSFGCTEAVLTLAVLLTRYEGVLLAGTWTLVGAFNFVRAARSRKLQLSLQAAAVSGGFAVFLMLKLALYGTIIPHAFALKTITTLYAPDPPALWSVWREDAWVWLALGLIGIFTLPRRLESFALVLYVVASTVSLIQGPFADYARYSVHMLPIAAMLASVPLSRLTHRYAPVTVGVLALLGYHSYTSLVGRREAVAAGAGHARCRTAIGEYLERSLPAGTPVLSSDIGVIAYAAPSIHFIDAVGLTSKDILQARMDGETADAVLFEQKPLYIADTCDDTCTRPRDFSANKWLSHESYWRTPLPRQHYTEHLIHGALQHRCDSSDDLSFGVSKFDFK